MRVRADYSDGKRTIAMPGELFIARLLQHVLPSGFKRIRHYGLLAQAAKAERLALARQLLAMPPAKPQAREDPQAFMRRVAAIEIARCSHCKIGQCRVMEHRNADRSLIAAALCRGAP
jgi:hypothetical protein